MDRDTRQSSLPASLIPYLYVAPRDSSTRTTLRPPHSTAHSEQNQCSHPSRSPLSLAPLLLPTSPATAFIHRSSSYPFIDNDNDRQLPPLQHLPPFQHFNSFEPGSSPDIEGDDAHKDKKRRAHSMDTDDNTKKSVRKTAVACNFCRGRKLRCNGAKPSCYNCTVRKFECEYVSTQRRRGPGKAPKGSRSRKGRSENSASSSKNLGDRLPTMVPDYELSPDLQPFTSVMTLEKFEFQLPNTSPQYPSDRHGYS